MKAPTGWSSKNGYQLKNREKKTGGQGAKRAFLKLRQRRSALRSLVEKGRDCRPATRSEEFVGKQYYEIPKTIRGGKDRDISSDKKQKCR